MNLLKKVVAVGMKGDISKAQGPVQEQDCTKIAKIFVDPNIVDHNGLTALMTAAKNGDVKRVKELLACLLYTSPSPRDAS